MAALPDGAQIDATVVPVDDFAPIEAGTYNVALKLSNGGPKDDGRHTIGLQFEVIDGPSEGRSFWLNFNFTNPKSQMNQDISRKQITQIANAAGLGVFADTDELLGIAINMSVKVNSKGGYNNNELGSVRPYDPAAVAASVARAPAARAAVPGQRAPAAAGAPAGGPARAWAKKT